MSIQKTLIIGTRGSRLALWQADEAIRLLNVPCQKHIIRTSGDRFQNIPLQNSSQMGFFTREIENQLRNRTVDLAVHSLKDLPTESPEGLTLGAYLPRGPVSDLLLIHPDQHDPLKRFPVKKHCRIGAGSLRRRALLRHFSPETLVAGLRGNVPTRVDKCRSGEYGAMILARAGMERLKLRVDDLVVYELNPAVWLPAPGQGVIAVQVRADDPGTNAGVQCLDHPATRTAAQIERRIMANFEGGCHSAFGAFAKPADGLWTVSVGLEDGENGWRMAIVSGKAEQLMTFGPEQAEQLHPVPESAGENLCTRIEL